MPNINDFLQQCENIDVFEGMTSISSVIKSISNGSSDRRILAVFYDKEKSEQKKKEISFIKRFCKDFDFEITQVTSEDISMLSSGDTHGGIIAVCTKRSFHGNFVNKLSNASFFALIDGIEDPYNFAYSIRSLYAAGVDGIILPQRNWMDFSGTVARSSAGTSELIDIYACNTLEAVKTFKNHGYKIVCASIRDSVSLYDYEFESPILLVVGGEKRGISRKILDLADVNIRIEYGREFMGSLPSASAVSVLAFEIARKKSLLKTNS